MNERITALIVKAHQSSEDKSEMVYNLCELIVRECADVASTRPYIDEGKWEHPSTVIKKYFGVSDE